MHLALNFRQLLTGFFLFGVTLGCSALSLGSARGTVWLGQPMELSIQIKLDTTDDAAALCFAVDVFHADASVNGEQVRVSTAPGRSRDEVSLRLRSAALVNEPVVTVVLKAGCVQPVTRRYVLLADVPADGAVLLAQPKADARPPDGAKTHEALIRQSVPLVTDRPTTTGRAIAHATVASARTATSSVRAQRSGRLAAKSRLQLEPLKFTAEHELVLRISTELLTVPTQAGSQRAQAAALWRAISATPEEILLAAQQFQSLKSDATALKMQNQKIQAAVADLEARRPGAQTERYSDVLVFGLLLALVATAGATGYLWRTRRGQHQPPWWDASQKPVGELENSARLARATNHVTPSAPHGAPVTVNLHTAEAMTGDGTAQERATVGRASEPDAMSGANFQTSQTDTSQAVKMDALLDAQQQADFFISFGQHDQAVVILQDYLSRMTDTSALIYLDLLALYHLQGRAPDYDLVRQQFIQIFNTQVPEFPDFGQWSRDLESYPSTLSHIVALWPSEKVLNFIEQLMFQNPGQDNQVLTLAAYRELLFLYAIARDVVNSGDGSDS